MTAPKYPYITIPLTGEDGNVFSIMGRCTRTARRAGVEQAEIDKFVKELTATGSYPEAIHVVTSWFDTE